MGLLVGLGPEIQFESSESSFVPLVSCQTLPPRLTSVTQFIAYESYQIDHDQFLNNRRRAYVTFDVPFIYGLKLYSIEPYQT